MGRRSPLQRRATTCATPRCPRPGGEDELKRLAGRVFSQALDRSKPLWELWLVEGLDDDRFALLSKTHHALVDGISGVDIATVLFDTSPDPAPVAPPEQEWIARPLPSDAQLLADALLERATVPAEIVRGVRAVAARPAPASPSRVGDGARSASARWPGRDCKPAPPSPFNVKIGPHRRFTWVRGDLGPVQGDQERARRHGQRRRADRRRRRARALPAPARRDAPRTSCSRRWCPSRSAPTSSAARSATASRRCGRRCRSASPTRSSGCSRSADAMDGHQGVRPGGGRPGADRAVRASRRRRSWPRRRGCRPASGSSTSSSRTCPGRSSRSTCSAASSSAIYPMVPLAENTGARDRDHELQRPAQLRPARPTSTRCPTSRRSPRSSGSSIDELAAIAGAPAQAARRGGRGLTPRSRPPTAGARPLTAERHRASRRRRRSSGCDRRIVALVRRRSARSWRCRVLRRPRPGAASPAPAAARASAFPTQGAAHLRPASCTRLVQLRPADQRRRTCPRRCSATRPS